jgi:serine/threonine protein kinase
VARYEVDAVLGRGGFGTVYRAHLQGDGGFQRVVAIKVLHRDIDENSLARFRDEARILGLIRDRAVVSVNAPILLSGRCALVMDYVDGVSLELLVKRKGPLPPRVALEIVQEAARALDAVYHHAGPDGQPLHVLHRDLKPANLQLTPTGAVKVLDFGIAKAKFDAREALTSGMLVGTTSYMSPDRLAGRDDPSDDVYALGVVLRRLLTAEKPVSPGVFEPGTQPLPADPDRDVALELAARMHALDRAPRPTARQVEELAGRLANGMPGPSLRDWSETEVKAAPSLQPDELVGEVLTEATRTQDVRPTAMLAASAASLATLGAVALLLSCAGLTALGVGSSTRSSDPAPAAIEDPVPTPASSPAPSTLSESVPEAAPEPEPAPTTEPEPATAPANLGSTLAAAPRPAPLPVPDPAPPNPLPVAPVPAQDPLPAPVPAEAPTPRPTRKLTFASDPAGALVRVGGAELGRTPLVAVPLPEGTHSVTVEGAQGVITRSIVVGEGRPTRFIWRGGEVWETHY